MPRAGAGLDRAGALFVTLCIAGQGIFLAYLFASYGRAAAAGDLARWSEFSATGWVRGDRVGNGAFIAHLLVAAVVLCAGAIQWLPVVRRRTPGLHRWSGRAYLGACAIGASSGLWLVWARGTVGDWTQHVAISVNALLLLACASMTWRTARARTFGRHREWATRTYLVAGGVFFFRLLLPLWLVIHRAPVGFDPNTFSGPFLTGLAWTVYVVAPLGLYEAYRYAARTEARAWVMTGVVWTVCAVVFAGIGAATLLLWVPRVG